VAALLSVPAAALAFTLEYSLGGTASFSVSQVLVAMTSVHVLIGIGEAIITALTVGAVMATRPDLVYGARGRLPQLELHSSSAVADAPIGLGGPA
jgi:cobalt/nickel transport system permease protein